MIVTAGSKIAIHMALMAILDPGDEVLILEPAWVSYTEQVRLCHGVPVTVPYDVAPTEIEPFITPRTKAVVLNYPNNPRGQLLGEDEWARLHELAVTPRPLPGVRRGLQRLRLARRPLRLGRHRRPGQAPHHHLQLDVEELRHVRAGGLAT